MDLKQKQRHIVDILFVLILFCVFALSAFMLVMIGSNVYRKTVRNMDDNYTTRTSLAYVTEKIHQFDETDAIEIGTFKGQDALILKTSTENQQYYTYIYMSGGYLKELFAAAGADLSPEAGQNILPIEDFQLKKVNDKLYTFTIGVDDGNQYTLYVSTHSANPN